MKATIKQVIFTDTALNGQPYKHKTTGNPFWMLHLELSDGKWVSKFYSKKEDDPSTKIIEGKEYDISYKQSWPYYNLIALYTLEDGGQVNQII